jgi:hypothetical protein
LACDYSFNALIKKRTHQEQPAWRHQGEITRPSTSREGYQLATQGEIVVGTSKGVIAVGTTGVCLSA